MSLVIFPSYTVERAARSTVVVKQRSRGRSEECKHCHRKFSITGLTNHQNHCQGVPRPLYGAALAGKCEVCGERTVPNARACRLHVLKEEDFVFVERVIALGYGDVPWKKIPADVMTAARREMASCSN